MLHLKAFGKRAYRRLLPSWQPFDSQQRLMLVRLDARFARGPLAEIQESANFIPEIREGTVVDHVFVFSGVIISNYIVLRYV